MNNETKIKSVWDREISRLIDGAVEAYDMGPDHYSDYFYNLSCELDLAIDGVSFFEVLAWHPDSHLAMSRPTGVGSHRIEDAINSAINYLAELDIRARVKGIIATRVPAKVGVSSDILERRKAWESKFGNCRKIQWHNNGSNHKSDSMSFVRWDEEFSHDMRFLSTDGTYWLAETADPEDEMNGKWEVAEPTKLEAIMIEDTASRRINWLAKFGEGRVIAFLGADGVRSDLVKFKEWTNPIGAGHVGEFKAVQDSDEDVWIAFDHEVKGEWIVVLDEENDIVDHIDAEMDDLHGKTGEDEEGDQFEVLPLGEDEDRSLVTTKTNEQLRISVLEKSLDYLMKEMAGYKTKLDALDDTAVDLAEDLGKLQGDADTVINNFDEAVVEVVRNIDLTERVEDIVLGSSKVESHINEIVDNSDIEDAVNGLIDDYNFEDIVESAITDGNYGINEHIKEIVEDFDIDDKVTDLIDASFLNDKITCQLDEYDFNDKIRSTIKDSASVQVAFKNMVNEYIDFNSKVCRKAIEQELEIMLKHNYFSIGLADSTNG